MGKMFWRTVRRPRSDHNWDNISMFVVAFLCFLVDELRFCLCLSYTCCYRGCNIYM